MAASKTIVNPRLRQPLDFWKGHSRRRAIKGKSSDTPSISLDVEDNSDDDDDGEEEDALKHLSSLKRSPSERSSDSMFSSASSASVASMESMASAASAASAASTQKRKHFTASRPFSKPKQKKARSNWVDEERGEEVIIGPISEYSSNPYA